MCASDGANTTASSQVVSMELGCDQPQQHAPLGPVNGIKGQA